MAQTDTAKLVGAPAIAADLGIPVYAVYRLADQKRIPFQDVSSTWATRRRRLLFDLDAVRAAYAALAEERAQRVS